LLPLLLQLTYLHRTQPLASAIEILNPLELKILKAKSPKLPKLLTVNWAVEAIAPERRLPRTSKQNTNWYPGTVARLVKIA
jgi:hypothetical protein